MKDGNGLYSSPLMHNYSWHSQLPHLPPHAHTPFPGHANFIISLVRLALALLLELWVLNCS